VFLPARSLIVIDVPGTTALTAAPRCAFAGSTTISTALVLLEVLGWNSTFEPTTMSEALAASATATLVFGPMLIRTGLAFESRTARVASARGRLVGSSSNTSGRADASGVSATASGSGGVPGSVSGGVVALIPQESPRRPLSVKAGVARARRCARRPDSHGSMPARQGRELEAASSSSEPGPAMGAGAARTPRQRGQHE